MSIQALSAVAFPCFAFATDAIISSGIPPPSTQQSYNGLKLRSSAVPWLSRRPNTQPSSSPCISLASSSLDPFTIDLDDIQVDSDSEPSPSARTHSTASSSSSQSSNKPTEDTPFSITSFRLKPTTSHKARRFRVPQGSKVMLKQAIFARARERARDEYAEKVKKDMANLAKALNIDPELLPEFRRRMDAAKQRCYQGYSPAYTRTSATRGSGLGGFSQDWNMKGGRRGPDAEKNGRLFGMRKSQSTVWTRQERETVEEDKENLSRAPPSSYARYALAMGKARELVAHFSDKLATPSERPSVETSLSIPRGSKSSLPRSWSHSWLSMV